MLSTAVVGIADLLFRFTATKGERTFPVFSCFTEVCWLQRGQEIQRPLYFGEGIRLRRQEMILFRTAYRTISAALWRLSFCIIRVRCVSTVLVLRLSMEATSLLDRPSASNWSISFSRSVSRS